LAQIWSRGHPCGSDLVTSSVGAAVKWCAGSCCAKRGPRGADREHRHPGTHTVVGRGCTTCRNARSVDRRSSGQVVSDGEGPAAAGGPRQGGGATLRYRRPSEGLAEG